MFGFREVIAVLSTACSLALLALAARDAFRNRTVRRVRFAALGLYGMLFGATAIVLWTREYIRTPEAVSPKPEIFDSKPEMPPDCSAITGRSERNESVLSEKTPDADEIAVFDPLNSRSGSGWKSRNLTEATVVKGKNRVAGSGANAGIVERSNLNAWDDHVYGALSHAFDVIELWFLQHGSPSPDGASGRSGHPADERPAALPDVKFVENTAELTTESIQRLRQFAKDLMNRPQSGVIEIQAQTNGDGPAPFQFILTQARAVVVRDFLSNEGVLNYRLIAAAMSPESEDSTMAKSQIRFVFRP